MRLHSTNQVSRDIPIYFKSTSSLRPVEVGNGVEQKERNGVDIGNSRKRVYGDVFYIRLEEGLLPVFHLLFVLYVSFEKCFGTK